MIEPQPTFGRLAAFAASVCVIGGGPVGIVTALALSRQGVRVLLLESGGLSRDADAQALSEADNCNPAAHHAPHITTARRLGGGSNLWGGRCVPFDPIDFTARAWLGLPAWPISDEDLAPYLDPAVAALDAGSATFRSPIAETAADDAFSSDTLERWASRHRTHLLHRVELEQSSTLLVALGATALGFAYDANGRISAIEAHLSGPGRGRIAVKGVVLAAGGNESTRLLLAEQRRRPRLFGGAEGPLGRNYMGHVNGQIADISLASPALHAGLDFHVDADGNYVRRRLVPSARTQADARLANIAFWPVVPRIHDAAHRSGPLSAVFLALATGPVGRRLISEAIRIRHLGNPIPSKLPHIFNVLRDPFATLAFAPKFLWQTKVARPRLPGLFLQNPARRYGLEYHSEHLPSPQSRLTLSERSDRFGIPRLRIDLRFSEDDAGSVVRAHVELDEWLQRNRLGRLDYRVAAADRSAAVLAEAKHGNHQIGTIRMGSDRRTSVVDGDCVTFDVPNLAVISTAVLPTSGQANPTLCAVQLGLRLVDRMVSGRVRLARPEPSERPATVDAAA